MEKEDLAKDSTKDMLDSTTENVSSDDKPVQPQRGGWKANIPLNGFLLLALLTVAVFISQYLSDVAGVQEQVAEEVAKEAVINQVEEATPSKVLLVDDFSRLVIDSSAVASSVDPSGIWKEAKGQNSWGSSWTILSDTLRSVLKKNASYSVAVLAGSKTWRDLDMRVAFSRPVGASLSVLFRYGDRGDHYSLNIGENLHVDALIEKKDTLGVDIDVLAQTRYVPANDSMEVAVIKIVGDKIRAGIEGSSFVETVDDQLTYGQVGLLADSAVVFHSIEIKN